MDREVVRLKHNRFTTRAEYWSFGESIKGCFLLDSQGTYFGGESLNSGFILANNVILQLRNCLVGTRNLAVNTIKVRLALLRWAVVNSFTYLKTLDLDSFDGAPPRPP